MPGKRLNRHRRCCSSEATAPITPAPVAESTGAPIELSPTLHFCLGRPMAVTDGKLTRFRNWLSNREKHPWLWPQPASETVWYELPQHLLHYEAIWFRSAAVRGWELLLRVVSSDQMKRLEPAARGLACEVLLRGLLENHGSRGICFWFPTALDLAQGAQAPAEVLLVPAALAADVAVFPELSEVFAPVTPGQYRPLYDTWDYDLLNIVPVRVRFEYLTWDGETCWHPPTETPWRRYWLRKFAAANGIVAEEVLHA